MHSLNYYVHDECFQEPVLSVACACCAKNLNEDGTEEKVSCNGDLEVESCYEWYAIDNNGQLRFEVHIVPLKNMQLNSSNI